MEKEKTNVGCLFYMLGIIIGLIYEILRRLI